MIIEAVIGPWMVGMAAVPQLVKLFQSADQARKARQFASTPRPSYEIPQAVKEYLNQAKFNAMASGLPGAGQLEAKQAQQQANAIGAIQRTQQSPSAMLAGIAAVDQNAKNGGLDLAVKGAQYRAGQQGQYYNALQQMGKQQMAQWEWNKKSPYLNAMAAASALRNASMRNLQGGLEGLSSIGQEALMLKKSAWKNTPDTQTTTQTPSIDDATLQQMYQPMVNDYYGYEVDPQVAQQYGMYSKFHRLFSPPQQ